MGQGRSFVVIVCTLILFSTNLWAKRFANQYSEFELPVGWECALEGSEWVCQSENEQRKKEAIIILAAKMRGEQDSLDAYQQYLKGTKTYLLPGGKNQVSEPKYTKLTEINDHRWVDALHLASEVPGFYTRYLATVKEDLGIAVTMSVGKDYYDQYKGVFDKIVGSLRVFRQKKADLSKLRMKGKGSDLDDVAFDDGTFVPAPDQKSDIAMDGKGGAGSGAGGGDNTLFYLIGALVVGFFILKKKKGAAAKKKGTKKKIKKK